MDKNREVADLQKKIRERIKNGHAIAKTNRGNKLSYKVFLVGAFILGIFNIGNSINYAIKEGVRANFWFQLLLGVGLLVQIFVWRSMLVSPPLKKKDFEKWVWQGYREQLIYWGLAFVFVTSAVLVSPNVFGKYQLLAAGTYFSIVVFILCLVLVIINPKLFVSGILGFVGKVSYWCFFLFLPLRVGIAIFEVFSFGSFGISILLLVAFIFILFIPILFSFRTRDLNEVQYYALRIIQPDKLFYALRPYQKELRNKYKALKIKLELDKDLSYAVKAELVKLYAQEHKNKNETVWFVVAMLTVLSFIVQSLLQLSIEDMIYVPVVKPVLEKLINYFSH